MAKEASSSSFTIGLILTIITAAAILSAAMQLSLGNDEITNESVTYAIRTSIVITLVIGSVVGTFYFQRWLAALWGPIMTVPFGAAAGVMALVPPNTYVDQAVLIALSCWVLITFISVSARFAEPEIDS